MHGNPLEVKDNLLIIIITDNYENGKLLVLIISKF